MLGGLIKLRDASIEIRYLVAPVLLSNGQDGKVVSTMWGVMGTTEINLHTTAEPTLDSYELLRNQAGGNLLYVLIGLAGCIGNILTLRVYRKFPDFYYKSYFLLGSLAIADFMVCFGLVILGGARLLQFFGAFEPTMHARPCLALMLPLLAGLTASITSDFAIAIDRLAFLLNPVFHRLRLGKKYVIFLTLIGWARAIAEIPLFFFFEIDETTVSPICTDQDKYIRNGVHDISYWADIGCIVATISIYLTTTCIGHRALILARDADRRLKGSHGFTMVINEKSYMQKYRDMQCRIYKVAIVLAACFVCTSFLTLVVTQAVIRDMNDEKRDSSTPYVFLFLLLNSSNNIVINTWRDEVFRKRLKQLINWEKIKQKCSCAKRMLTEPEIFMIHF